ncbi:hypothetical protein [Xanthomonas phaseoli]|uniref:hypothetical protein n=1 Tax=Xanthomonas phaseoli TaxID=1985254 RepID=UPI001E455420|nr:hypothetical protein [Xanthomonas phaseoli]MCC8470213.1 hypothetical protein [Xanthomonas phaseoli]
MRNLINLVVSAAVALCPVIAFAGVQGGQAGTANLQSPNSVDLMEICANVPIPEGWVVTSIRAGCGSGNGLYEIRRVDPARGTMNMCGLTAVPRGWAVTYIQGGCIAGVPNYQIRYAAPNSISFSMCNVPASSVPPGWVVTSVAKGCGLPGYAYWEIREALPELGTMEVCNVAPVPSGWVILAQRTGCIAPNALLTIKYMP